ncbi:hypothetical protein CCP3SC15_1440009 [Gammaproteobacteria bacterium]
MKRPVTEKTLTEIVIDIINMDEHMRHITRVTPRDNYAESVHYVGMNYDLHINELRRRGQATIANRYEERAAAWRQ